MACDGLAGREANGVAALSFPFVLNLETSTPQEVPSLWRKASSLGSGGSSGNIRR